MFFKKTIVYCLSVLVLLVPLLVSAQMVVTPVFADEEVAGPEEAGCGVAPDSFTYVGYTFTNWKIDTLKNFNISEHLNRPCTTDNSDAMSRVLRQIQAEGFPYVILIDTYKCKSSGSSSYNCSDFTFVYAFSEKPVLKEFLTSDIGVFNYRSQEISKVRNCYVYDNNSSFSFDFSYFYSYFNGLSSSAIGENYQFKFAENFMGCNFVNSTYDSYNKGISYYSSGYVNIMSNFNPEIEDVTFIDSGNHGGGGSSFGDNSLTGSVHSGSVSAISSLSGIVDCDETKKYNFRIENGRTGSIQYIVYISTQPATWGISSSYQKYVWAWQSVQTVSMYRQTISQTVVDTLVDVVDIYGSSFPLSVADKIPTYLLLKSISDKQLLGCYTQSRLSCPFHYLNRSNWCQPTDFTLSSLNLNQGTEYYFNVVWRDTTAYQMSVSTYNKLYYDDVAQLDSNYNVALSQAFSLNNNLYVPPKTDGDGNLVDDNGNKIVDDGGNPVRPSNNYSDNVVSIRDANVKSDAYATGGSASAQGGSASVINNNNPTFSNNITVGGIGGGSGSGTVQDFDDVDVSTFQNLWDSCGNFFSFVKKIWATFPLQASLVSGIFVVLFVLRVARR